MVGIGHENVHMVAFHSEVAALQLNVIAHIEGIDKLTEEHVAVQRLSLLDVDDALLHGRGASHAIDARHTRHDDHILATGKQRGDCRKTKPVNLVVDGQVLVNVGIGCRKIGFRLVVVVVAHVVFHRIFGEESLHLLIELCSERLVMAQDEGRHARLCDDVGHRKCLA